MTVADGDAARPLRRALDEALAQTAAPLVLAVSGGADSIALLHAMARWAPARVATVATFDHGTGAWAREAAARVEAEARRLGLPVVSERARTPARTEAAWREQRWDFLWRVARASSAAVATAHTADDQLETIVMRLLRGTGVRGLAALAAPGPIVRPWRTVRRAALRAWLRAEGLSWCEDPANRDRRHQRVRVREDLLPAIDRVDAGFAEAMLALGDRAAVWRTETEAFAASLPFRRVAEGVWRVPREVTAGWSADMLAVVWPAWLASTGVLLDADGTRRLLRFTLGDAPAGELQLPGGATVVRTRSDFEVRAAAVAAARRSRADRRAGLRWPGWRFTALDGPPADVASPWVAAFSAGTALVVRNWQAGDRIVTPRAGAGRRIVRYLVEAGVPRLDRPAWPVVLADGEVAWVPGVCRGSSAPPRSGRSDLIWYRSEREFG